jgi:uncharacterized protein YecE (DUF72 family)
MTGRNSYFLGLPAWAFPGWKDRYFTDAPTRLASYATVFNTVEGNTTFYRTPDAATVLRWLDSVAERPFRFCFKLPRDVTHESRPDLGVLQTFLDAIQSLSGHLGPLLVQFPATVGPAELERFAPVFERLKDRVAFVIEVRHPEFFTEPELLESTLERFQAGRVTLDSRPLFEGDRAHPEILEALHEKPDLPVLTNVHNDVALIRLILHPDIVSNRRYIDEWAQRVRDYSREGVTTYMMIHCPNNAHCPSLAEDFHNTLRTVAPELGLAAMPAWPVPQQQSLI